MRSMQTAPQITKLLTVLVLTTLLWPLRVSATATGADDTPPVIHHAVVANPLTTAATLAASALGLPSLALDLRYHQQLGDRWGLTVGVEAAALEVFLRYDLVALRVGSRVSLSRPGELAGWHLLPYTIAGWGWAHNSHGKPLASAPLLGAGVETGYTWAMGAFVVECGGGLYASGYVGRGRSVLRDVLPPLMPSLNASVGYGW